MALSGFSSREDTKKHAALRACIIWVAALGTVLMGLFPPWVVLGGRGLEVPIGYRFILSPPTGDLASVRLDVPRLLVQWVVVLALALALLSTLNEVAATYRATRRALASTARGVHAVLNRPVFGITLGRLLCWVVVIVVVVGWFVWESGDVSAASDAFYREAKELGKHALIARETPADIQFEYSRESSQRSPSALLKLRNFLFGGTRTYWDSCYLRFLPLTTRDFGEYCRSVLPGSACGDDEQLAKDFAHKYRNTVLALRLRGCQRFYVAASLERRHAGALDVFRRHAADWSVKTMEAAEKPGYPVLKPQSVSPKVLDFAAAALFEPLAQEAHAGRRDAAFFFEERLEDFERVLKSELVDVRARVIVRELSRLPTQHRRKLYDSWGKKGIVTETVAGRMLPLLSTAGRPSDPGTAERRDD